jgi:predicted MPP superfamily phosphohydrolase
MYKDKEKLKFHVFTDNHDDWKQTEREVKDTIKQWRKDGYKNFRIYTCEWNAVEGIYDDVDCIYTTGNFPM